MCCKFAFVLFEFYSDAVGFVPPSDVEDEVDEEYT
jgi:hypothetical protein